MIRVFLAGFLVFILSFQTLADTSTAVPKCEDLGSSIELGKTMQGVTWNALLGTWTTFESTPFPTVVLTNVTLASNDAVKNLEGEFRIANGKMQFELTPIQWVGGEKAKYSGYQIGLRMVRPGSRDFVGIPRAVMETPEGLASVYGKVSEEMGHVTVFETEYSLGGYLAYGSIIRVKDGKIINIAFRYPRTIEKKSRYTAYKEHETLCVKSYEDAFVQASE